MLRDDDLKTWKIQPPITLLVYQNRFVCAFHAYFLRLPCSCKSRIIGCYEYFCLIIMNHCAAFFAIFTSFCNTEIHFAITLPFAPVSCSFFINVDI